MSQEEKNKQNNDGSGSSKQGSERNQFEKGTIGDSKDKMEELRRAAEIPPRTTTPKPKSDNKE